MLSQKKVEVGGVTYTLQKIPFRSYMEMNDKHTNKNGVLLKTPYMEDLLKHCVVSPKVAMPDFDNDMQSGMELIAEVESFLIAKAEPKSDKTESK